MRRPARNQSLPAEEAAFLQTLRGTDLKLRARRLYEAGWTLSAIGEPISKSRSTVRFWVNNVPGLTSGSDRSVPVPVDKSYVRKRPISPGITDAQKNDLAYLAPIARMFRARLPYNHPAAEANRKMTDLCKKLHASGVPIQQIANVAGVTYRAMYRRVHS